MDGRGLSASQAETEARSIHEENMSKLAKMSEEEILEEQKKLLQMLGKGSGFLHSYCLSDVETSTFMKSHACLPNFMLFLHFLMRNILLLPDPSLVEFLRSKSRKTVETKGEVESQTKSLPPRGKPKPPKQEPSKSEGNTFVFVCAQTCSYVHAYMHIPHAYASSFS